MFIKKLKQLARKAIKKLKELLGLTKKKLADPAETPEQ